MLPARHSDIADAVLAAAQLAALGRIDAPKPDARSMDFQRVAVDDAGLTNKIIGQRRARQQQEHQYDGTWRMLMTLASVVTADCAD